MPRQQQKRHGESAPSTRSQSLPASAVKFTKNTSAQGRLAFAEVVINEETFRFFNGLKVCSFVVLRPKEPGGPRRVYVPGHKLPSGQSFQHLQAETGDLETLRGAIRAAYEATIAASETAGDKEAAEANRMSEDDTPF